MRVGNAHVDAMTTASTHTGADLIDTLQAAPMPAHLHPLLKTRHAGDAA
jgi:hypothetical protein